MLDALYLTGSILFFALMAAYVAACERLGRRAGAVAGEDRQ